MNRSLLSVCVMIFVLSQFSCPGQVFHISAHAKKAKPFPYTLNDVYEDRTGYVWLATDHGLLRYDGRTAATAIAGNFTTFFPVNGGAITFGRGKLIWLEKDKMPDTTRFALTGGEPAPFAAVYDVDHAGNDALLMLTDLGAFVMTDHKLSRITLNNVSDIRKKGTLLKRGSRVQMLTEDGMLYTWDPSLQQFLTPSVTGGSLSTLIDVLPLPDGSCIIAEEHQLKHLRQDSLRALNTSGLPSGAILTDIALFGNDLLVGTATDGLWFGKNNSTRFDFKKILNGNEPHRTADLPFAGVANVSCGPTRNVWVTVNSDLWLLKPRPFERVALDIPMVTFEQAVFAMAGKVYLDAESVLYEVTKTETGSYAGGVSDIGIPQTQSAIAYHDGRLWISTVDNRIFYYQDGHLKLAADLSARGGTVFNLYTDRQGNLWVQQAPSHSPIVGTLKITHDLDIVAYGEDAGFKSRMLCAKESPDGTLYFSGIGEKSYLYVLNPTTKNFINLSVPMDFDYGDNFEVHEVAVGADSTIWLASTAGFLRYRDGRIEKISFDELEDAEAVGVLVAQDGAVWFGTDSRGVIRYDRGSYRLYDQRAGLATNFISYRSLREHPDGSLWVGTREGMFVVRTDGVASAATHSPMIASVRGLNGDQSARNIFGYHNTIELDAVSLTYPSETVQYGYRLSGYNNNRWITLRKNEKVSLTNLQNGSYTLEIRARQVGGHDWSAPTRYDFLVKPAWYLQPLAYVVYALVIGLITVAGVRTYNRRLIREKQILEAKVSERTREIAAKNEEITVQNEEIVSQMEEISMQVQKLRTMNDLLAEQRDQLVQQKEIIQQQNKLLEEAKNDLEQKVHERTNELSAANQELIDHNIQLQQFAFMTAHNLRSPVARLLGLTSIFNKNDLSDPFNLEVVKRIDTCAEDLDEIIRDISLILQIKKSVTETFEPVSIPTVLAKVLDSFKTEIANKRITIINEVDRTTKVHGIEPYLHSVFYNAISNSIKYADRRKDPEIRLQSRVSANELQVILCDNGIGFDSEKQRDKLFKPFSRLNSMAEGKGLGLYMMKIEMDAMHAAIDIHSQLDHGTTVILRFPVPAN